MRKITKESSEAFVNFDQYKKSNTEVAIKYGYSSSDEIARFYLHGNCIAEINRSKLPELRLIYADGIHQPLEKESMAFLMHFIMTLRSLREIMSKSWLE